MQTLPTGIVDPNFGHRCSVRRHFFFFFQAEDGIRDLTVTGVQTCALPISSSALLIPRIRKRLSRLVSPPSSSTCDRLTPNASRSASTRALLARPSSGGADRKSVV